MSQQIVDILLKIDARTEQLVRAERGVKQLTASFKSVAGAAAMFTGINLSIQGMVGFLKSAITEGIRLQHHFQDVADQLSTTSEAVQVLDYAGRRMGGSIDELTRLGIQFNARLAEAASKGGEAVKYFDALGLSIEELSAMPFERRLEAFGRALARNAGDAAAMNAAVKLTGAESQRFLNIIRQYGVDGYEMTRALADASGQINDMSESVARLDQVFSDLKRRGQNALMEGVAVAGTFAMGWLGLANTQIEQVQARIDHVELRLARAKAAMAGGDVRAAMDVPMWTEQLREYRRVLDELNAAQSMRSGGAASGADPEAARRANAEMEAGRWLAANAEKMEDQILAAQELMLSDEARLRILDNRIALLQQERVAAIASAAGENTARRAEIETAAELTKIEKEARDLRAKIDAQEGRAQAARRVAMEQFADQIALAIAQGDNLGDVISMMFKRIAAEAIAAAIKVAIFGESLESVRGGSTGGGIFGSIMGAMGYAGGGYTGAGGKHQPAGIVHRGEYVMPADVVGRYGAAYFDGALRAMRSGPGYAGGGAVGRAMSAAPAFGGATINIEYKFEAGVTPEQLAGLIPEMEARTRAGVMDGIARRQMRMS